MYKKLTMACMAVAAVAAFALPAVAQATNKPVITHPTGTVLATGTKITATNIGNTLLEDTSGNTFLTCNTATMTGTLTKNTTGTAVEGEISAASFTGTGAGGACTGFFGLGNQIVDPESLPWCLRSTSTMATDEFQVLGGACGKAPTKVHFKLTPSSGEPCTYQSTTTTVAKGTFQTHSAGDAVLSVPRTGHTPNEDAGFTKISGPFFCPNSGALRMSFTLETDSATVSPLYISE